MSYMKPICCKNIFHEHHGQLCFYFLILFLKHVNKIESFIFFGIKAQIFYTTFSFVDFWSKPLHILKLYDIVSLTLKTSPNIVGNRHEGIYKLWTFFYGS